MANSKVYGYQKRRWRTFLTIYQGTSVQNNLNKICNKYEGKKLNEMLRQISIDHGIPVECIPAIKEYIKNPDLDDDTYIKLVSPPIDIIETDSKVLIDIHPGVNKTDLKEAINVSMPILDKLLKTKYKHSRLGKRVDKPATRVERDRYIFIKFMDLLGYKTPFIQKSVKDAGYGYVEQPNIRKLLSRSKYDPTKLKKPIKYD